MPQDIYQYLRPLLFRWNSDPEELHSQLFQLLGWLERHRTTPLAKWVEAWLENTFCFHDPRLQQTLWHMPVGNPVGLAAGFDKDGKAAHLWASLGFGFAELGTITYHAQLGNPRPRLFRLPVDRAVLNRMGFNNQGAVALAERLAAGTIADRPPTFPIGINLGKSKITPLDAAVDDYVQSFRLLRQLGDYFVVNVSSPNTPGLRWLQAAEHLGPILAALQQENPARKPLLVKIAPDLSVDEITDILHVAMQHNLAGIIATNTTVRRDGLMTQSLAATGNSIQDEAGGISGAPLREMSTAVIRFIWQQTQGKLPIVGVGGIFTAEDAWEKITAGASLVQIYTGWVYEGPWMVRRILAGLLQKLEIHGLNHLSQAIGLDHSAPIQSYQGLPTNVKAAQ